MELFASFAGILGLIIGSFLNVVVYRFNTGKSISKGRSQCFSCSKHLEWHELIPVISFLKQDGKCKGCRSNISLQYPVVELLTGYLFFLTAFHLRYLASISLVSYFASTIFYFIIWSLLIIVLTYDFKHKIIPDFFSYLFIFLSLVGMFFIHDGSFYFGMVTLLRVMAGPILAAPFAILWLVSGGKWIGFGDAKLALGIGFLLGLSQGLSAILLAFWIGAVVSILLVIIPNLRRLILNRKKITLKTEVPFAPFLILGIAIVFFGNIYLTTIMSWFQF
jgi:leader peptidase (prepilin peptidase) / N-methyltransferase